jgi:hypothetical protein
LTGESVLKFRVSDNYLSKLLPFVHKVSLHGTFKSMITNLSNFDFQLTVGALL